MISDEMTIYGTGVNLGVLNLLEGTHRIILDVGCGAGGHAAALAAEGRIVDGVTISHEEAALVSAWCRNTVIHDVEKGLPESLSGPYDLCLCSHVIEHLRDPAPLLRAVRLRLAPGGSLVVALPNLLHYRHRWNLLCGRFNYESHGIMDSTHFKWYTWKTGRQLLEGHGFRVERQLADGGIPIGKLRGLLPGSVTRTMDSVATNHYPGLFGWQHLYLARLC
jgi:SAM-dependent methyltransferase